MRIFKTKDLALRAAHQVLEQSPHSDLELGPMLATREGNVMAADQIREACRDLLRTGPPEEF